MSREVMGTGDFANYRCMKERQMKVWRERGGKWEVKSNTKTKLF